MISVCVKVSGWSVLKKFYITMGLSKIFFAHAIVKLLAMGRGKGRNIYITGPANCGKNIHS